MIEYNSEQLIHFVYKAKYYLVIIAIYQQYFGQDF